MTAATTPTTSSASATTKAESATTYRPSREQWDALQAQFHFFNAALFENKLPEPILNMSRHAKSRGFFAPKRWQRGGDVGDAKTHEISLNPDYFNRDQRSIASTLVHEMAHLWQQVYGKNASRGYHDKEWALKMETIGLMPSSTGAPGGKRTGKNMTHYVVEGGAFALAWKQIEQQHSLPWKSGMAVFGELPTAKKKDPSKLKYKCSKCKAACWGKPSLNIDCGDCGVAFELVEPK